MKFNWTLIFSLLIIVTACQQKTKTSTDVETVEVSRTDEVEKETILPSQQKMLEINEMIEGLSPVKSLRWEKISKSGQQSFTSVSAYLNDDGIPVKIIEEYDNGNYQNQGERSYYLENNEIIAFEENRDVWIDSTDFLYEEIRSFYDNKEPVKNEKRSASSVSDIENTKWTRIRPEKHSLTKIENILSGKGRFETHFISVIDISSGLFLLLGEPKDENRYQTAVRVDEKTPFLEDLLNNLEKYKFRPIEIQFTIEGGAGQPQFQVLTHARWKDEE
jgi:hypothetical protein